jgi:hypothetical protein
MNPQISVKERLIENPTNNSRSYRTETLRAPSPTLMKRPKVLPLTIYSENMADWQQGQLPLPRRKPGNLVKREYPQATCAQNLPIDEFPNDDAYLPWIHDYFVSKKDTEVRFIAQNKRRCNAGHDESNKFWEPQVALFQPISIQKVVDSDKRTHYKLATPETATYHETRFLCFFHDESANATTFSKFPFNYEYVLWRKRGNKPMLHDKDQGPMELSQLLFSCPIPELFQNKDHVYLDIVPIRIPARKHAFFTKDTVGPTELARLQTKLDFNLSFGTDHVLPPVQQSGRWANLQVCRRPTPPQHHRLVACTWTAESYHRRGDAVRVSDSARRLKEWIVFHRMVGFDHLYLYDNTVLFDESSGSSLKAIADNFSDFVTYIPWSARVCNNNRPNNKNPGERSSQYAAEASCRERYGPYTDWMTFIDTDEYLVPMNEDTWHPLLERYKDNAHVLKLKSSRGKPRVDLMRNESNPDLCYNPSLNTRVKFPPESCAVPNENETFLKVYNCDYIKPPLPDRFSRAQKQIFRPDFVLSHFVHYSLVTTTIATTYKDTMDKSKYERKLADDAWHDVFLNDTEGALVHTKAFLPHETMFRSSQCYRGSKIPCPVGIVCPESTPFEFEDHQTNQFVDDHGKYCNCWINPHVERELLPRLDKALLHA